MAQAEGVIQFSFCLAAPGGEPLGDLAQPLLAWRAVLRRLQLIGQAGGRYGGLGYGNVSRRLPGAAGGFLITASQTAGIADAGVEHLVWVRRWDLGRFHVEAEGALPPSSESLTHAMLYASDAQVHWVFHGHCPDIWHSSAAAGLPAIDADVGYGSPRMAAAVSALLRAHSANARGRGDGFPSELACVPVDSPSARSQHPPLGPLVFVTLGHEDGVFACGGSAEATGGALAAALARALACGQP